MLADSGTVVSDGGSEGIGVAYGQRMHTKPLGQPLREGETVLGGPLNALGSAANLVPEIKGAGVVVGGVVKYGDDAARIAKGVRFSNLAPTEAIGDALTFSANQIIKTSYSGKLNYVVTEAGQLVIGRSGHTSLSKGADVLAAGEAKFVNGGLKWLDNASGHYKPNGASALEAAESAFQRSGFDAAGKYLERKY